MQHKWTALLNITRSAQAHSDCKANPNLDKIPNEVPVGQTFSALPLKMMNGEVEKRATFTSHWLLSQKQSTSDLYLMQRIIPKHISVCHCWWCSFSVSFQHAILRSTQYAEAFHTPVLLTRLAAKTFRATETGELYNHREANQKKFKLNKPSIFWMSRI